MGFAESRGLLAVLAFLATPLSGSLKHPAPFLPVVAAETSCLRQVVSDNTLASNHLLQDLCDTAPCLGVINLVVGLGYSGGGRHG